MKLSLRCKTDPQSRFEPAARRMNPQPRSNQPVRIGYRAQVLARMVLLVLDSLKSRLKMTTQDLLRPQRRPERQIETMIHTLLTNATR